MSYMIEVTKGGESRGSYGPYMAFRAAMIDAKTRAHTMSGTSKLRPITDARGKLTGYVSMDSNPAAILEVTVVTKREKNVKVASNPKEVRRSYFFRGALPSGEHLKGDVRVYVDDDSAAMRRLEEVKKKLGYPSVVMLFVGTKAHGRWVNTWKEGRGWGASFSSGSYPKPWKENPRKSIQNPLRISNPKARSRKNPSPPMPATTMNIATELALYDVTPYGLTQTFGITLAQAQLIYDARVFAYGPGGKGTAWLRKQIEKVLKKKTKNTPTRKNPKQLVLFR